MSKLPPPLPVQPSERLKIEREKRKLSVHVLGMALGVSGSAVLDWEQGKRPPKLHTALLLQRLFGIKAEAWVEGLDEAETFARSVFVAREAGPDAA